MTRPPFELLPECCVADTMAGRRRILRDMNRLCRSPDESWDHGTAFNCKWAVDHAHFLRRILTTLADGLPVSDSDLACGIDSARQLEAWHLADLDRVNSRTGE